MHNNHWTEDELFERFYGLRPDDDHLSGCAECAGRLSSMRMRYEQSRPVRADVSPEFLAAQRRAIHTRIHAKRRTLPKVLVPVIVALLVVVAVIVRRPTSIPPPANQQISDSELFEDVFNRISDPLPSSAEPIRSLFEVQK
jgi:hypothetical protein